MLLGPVKTHISFCSG